MFGLQVASLHPLPQYFSHIRTIGSVIMKGCVQWNPIFMPPTSEKLREHIGLGLSVRPSVRPSVCPSVRNLLAAEKLKNRLCWNLEIIYVACT